MIASAYWPVYCTVLYCTALYLLCCTVLHVPLNPILHNPHTHSRMRMHMHMYMYIHTTHTISRFAFRTAQYVRMRSKRSTHTAHSIHTPTPRIRYTFDTHCGKASNLCGHWAGEGLCDDPTVHNIMEVECPIACGCVPLCTMQCPVPHAPPSTGQHVRRASCALHTLRTSVQQFESTAAPPSLHIMCADMIATSMLMDWCAFKGTAPRQQPARFQPPPPQSAYQHCTCGGLDCAQTAPT